MAKYRSLEIEDGHYPEPSLTDNLALEDLDDEYSRMAAHVEEFQGMTEVAGEDI